MSITVPSPPVLFVAGIVGLPSDMLDVPVECNFDHRHGGVPASIKALWIRLTTPLMVLVALYFIFSITWVTLARRKRGRKFRTTGQYIREHYTTCLVVISVVSLYFSYIGIVRELLRSINCIHVDEQANQASLEHPYAAYAILEGHRSLWAEDTSVICFKGSHLPVAIVGVLGLFAAICGILLIIFWLPLNAKNLTKTGFVSRYWFLYQAYRKTWYTNAWESTILTRKCLVAAVLVFSANLGASLQASMCAGILVIAHMLHSCFWPFRIPEQSQFVPVYAGRVFEVLRLPRMANFWVDFNNSVHLNILESGSLFSSIVVFFSAIILHDANASVVGRNFMIAFTLAINLTFLLFILYRLYAGLHVLLDLKLEIRSPTYMAIHENRMCIWSFICKVAEIIRTIKNCESDVECGKGEVTSEMTLSSINEDA